MITLTKKAVEKLKQIAASEGISNLLIRVKVVGGGCAGFSYDMYFEDNPPTDMDEQFNQDGIVIVSDPLSYQYLDGTDIEYTDGLITSGFKFNNPNVAGNCGCGHSFSV